MLDYLAERESTREESLRAATRASKALLAGMVRKKWIVREDLSEARDAARTIKVAFLKTAEGKLNANQKILIDTLAAAGGKVPVEALQSLEVPRTTLSTLVKRGLVGIAEEPAELRCFWIEGSSSPVRFPVQSGAADGAEKYSGTGEYAQVRRHVAARDYGVGQDRHLSGGHAISA